MELKSKALKSAVYSVECESGEYAVRGTVNISNGAIVNIDNGTVEKSGGHMASFTYFGTTLAVNFNAQSTLDEQTTVNSLIADFKETVLAE